MDLRRLRLFLAVASHGSFTRAAAAEFMTQPSISEAIRDLETELGLELFRRNGRQIALTRAGEALLGPAREVLRSVEACGEALADITGLVTGRVEICSMVSLQAYPLADIVGRFRVKYPGVDVNIEAPDERLDLSRLVASGRYDIGFAVDEIITDDLVRHDVGSLERRVVLPPGSKPRDVVDGRELADLPLVLTSPGARGLQERLLALEGMAPHIAVRVTDRDAILPLVLAGAGATLLPAAAADDAKSRGAVVAACDSRLAAERVFLVHRRGRLGAPIEAFVAIAEMQNFGGDVADTIEVHEA